MKRIVGLCLLSAVLFLWSSTAYSIPRYNDFGDAPSDRYNDASHHNSSWQRLGSNWSNETGTKKEDNHDDGVTWSTNGVDYSNDLPVYSGQTVTFKFDMYKELWGHHYADYLKAWIDWDMDGIFEENNEVVIFEEQTLSSLPNFEYSDNSADITTSFLAEVVIPEGFSGEFWLRARVVCSESLGYSNSYRTEDGYLNPWSADKFNRKFTSDGHYFQGEVEDYALTVQAAPVPEPSTMILLGVGLAGLAGFGRKKMRDR